MYEAMSDFSIDLSKFVGKTTKNAELIIKKAFFELSSDIIRDTPVDQGRLRNNWFAGVNQYNTNTTEKADKSGSESKQSLSGYNTFKLGNSLTLSNNLPYAMAIEYGHSKKAPAGMVRINITKWSKFIEKNAKAIR